MINLLRTKPAAVTGAISAIISLAISFGVHLTTEQVGSIMAVVPALGALFLEATSNNSGNKLSK